MRLKKFSQVVFILTNVVLLFGLLRIVNYTNKTQFLFRIEKGVLDTNNQRVNDYFPPEDIQVPFRNMIYIGDSDTDIPCVNLSIHMEVIQLNCV